MHLVRSTRRWKNEESDAGVNMDSTLDSIAMQKCTMSPFVETNRIWEKKEGYLLINMSLFDVYFHVYRTVHLDIFP